CQITQARKIESKFKKTEDEVFNFAINQSYFIASINSFRNELISKTKLQLEHDLDQIQNGLAISAKVLNTDHENMFSLFEFLYLFYKNDISILNKLKYFEFFNFTKLIELPVEYRNKNYITFYPISNFRYFISNSMAHELNLLMADGCLIKRLKIPNDHYCKLHVYESKILWVSCSLNFDNTLIKVFDLNLNLLKEKKIDPGFIYFFNSNFINVCMNDQNVHRIYDTDLNQVLALTDIYRNPLIDLVNDRIMFLQNEMDDKKLIEKIKINTFSSFSFIIDEESNIYIRMMDSTDSLISNQLALIDNHGNSYALF
ncbi:hypothetical protein BpHYR1_036869, partial [Brachionus plicatilis]